MTTTPQPTRIKKDDLIYKIVDRKIVLRHPLEVLRELEAANLLQFEIAD